MSSSSLRSSARSPDQAGADKDQPLDRTLAVLECVLDAPGRFSATTLAAELGLPLPSVARLVVQLEARGLIRRVLGTRQLAPGARLLGLGLGAARAAFMGDAPHQLLVSLAAQLREHCQIGVISGTEVVYLDSAKGARGASLQFEPGEHAPIHCTSTGKLFLAELDDAELVRVIGRRPLRRFTPSTITNPAGLIEEVKMVRRRGWAATDSEYAAGVVGCAVPIRGRDNIMIASLAVAVPAARTTASAVHRFVPALREAAKAMGAALEAACRPG